MKKRIVFLLAVVLAIALSLPRPAAAADGMTLSDVTRCVNAEGELTCEQKTLVNVGVSYGVSANLDVAYLGPLSETLRFEITKTEPKYIYPLRYLHIVPYTPHEEVRRVPNSSVGIQSCVDGATAANPSCGWTLDGAGNKIHYSQGFCSNRDLLDLKTCGDKPAPWRGDEVLGTTSSLADSYSTAYCLREGTLFFDGYEIDPPRRDYEVSTKIWKGDILLISFKVTPAEPVYFLNREASNPDPDSQHAVQLKLMGEAALPIAPPDLSNYILYVPVSPPDHPYVQDYQHNMLLVPREMVTPDGSECNKVGVSFAAFRKQGMLAPTTVAGDCLGNQLYQLHESDLALLTQNPRAETKYMVSGKKKLKDLSLDRSLELKSPIRELNYSTVALELDAANVGSITNEAVAYIKEAYVLPFMAMTNDGTLVAVIKNAGAVRASFFVTVHDCMPAIVGAIPPQARTLSPSEEATLEFDIATNSNMNSSHMCIVTLVSATGRVFDEVRVWFDTQKHNSVYARDLQLKNKESQKAN